MIKFILLIYSIICSIELNYVSIFNGENLDGWKIYGTEKWYVENGELICESGPDKEYGYLATNEFYRNFELSLDFNQVSDGNSGVFFRSSIEGIKISGWQVEVAPPGSYSGGIYESYGRGWLIKPDKVNDNVVVMNEWNNMKIKVVDDNITTFINGIKIIELKDKNIGEANGSIALQIHSGGGIKVRWKNIKIKQL